MRSPTEASPSPWPTRIPRPWLVASAAGLLFGSLLLHLEQLTGLGQSYPEYPPRAAVYDPHGLVDAAAPLPEGLAQVRSGSEALATTGESTPAQSLPAEPAP